MVKYYKEKMRLAEADRLRKNRMTFIKAYLILIVFFAATMIVNLLNFLHIGSTSFLDFLFSALQYIFVSLMLILKLWLSMLVQKFTI
jgi:hypothetical protein